MKRIVLVLISSLFVGACSMFGYNAGVKEPPYQILLQEDSYELREYPKIVVVTASAEGDFRQAQDESFNKLFDYISGKNITNQEIPMTAPVLMQSKGQEIPMTAPVLMEETNKGWTMVFVLPQEYTAQTAPRPEDSSLRIEERIGMKYAVLRFNGLFREKNFQERSAQLMQWIEAKNLKPVGPILRAGYNPPWTLPPLKRNEVMIEVE
jgi:DNA gyrase inhibitor GyrI